MEIHIYTDGSCSSNPGPGGYGSVFLFPEGTKTLRGNSLKTTNNQMELKAVAESLRVICILHRDEKSKDTYEIFSDSAYVINAISKNWLFSWASNGWKTKGGTDVRNIDLWKEILKYISYIHKNMIVVSFTKVKGHSGNCFNDLADKIAQEETLKAVNEVAKNSFVPVDQKVDHPTFENYESVQQKVLGEYYDENF